MLRWLGTVLCLIGMLCAAVNAYPANLVFAAIGSSLWCAHGVRIRDVALWLVESAAVVIAAGGLLLWAIR